MKELLNDLIAADEICRQAYPFFEKAGEIREAAQAEAACRRKKKKTQTIILAILCYFLLRILPLPFQGIFSLLFLVLVIKGGMTLYRTKYLPEIEEQLQQQMEEAQRQEDAGRSILEKHAQELSFLPEDYRYPIATGYLVKIVRDGRTEDLNEALLMLDEQLHRWSIENANQEIVAQQQQQTQALKGIRRSSAVSAAAKMACIGYSHISAKDGIMETGIWSWPNDVPAPELLGIRNPVSSTVESVLQKTRELTNTTIAHSEVPLTIYDPEAVDGSGNPVRMVRRAETNLGDFVVDAIRAQTGADIGIIGGGAVRTDLDRGDISYSDILAVFPFKNQVAVIRATGRQIVDGLEWGTRVVPGENGGFMQVSGLSYEIHVSVPSGCQKDENGMMTGIEGERRVRNVMVNGEPIDPDRTYTVASTDYYILDNGDGHTAFEGAEVLQDQFKVDSQVLIDYIVNDLGSVIGGEYADPYGQGRIVIVENE